MLPFHRFKQPIAPPDPLRSYPAAVAHLKARLAEPLPGTAAQLRLAPAYRRNPGMLKVTGKDCREAAVLALLFPLEGAPALVLTVRPDHLRQHAGQVSFPGGRREDGETLLEAALREAEEEVNLVTRDVEILGELSPLYIPPSNFCVYPFVGALPYEPDLVPHDAEVAAILHVPLARLATPDALQHAPWTLQGQEVIVPYFDLQPHRLWGATAMMLSELLAVM